ncbi:MAG TPA: hypothetical protein VGH11_08925 [Jatrophihabitans sp.]|jgi:hypothetical protein
MTWLAAPTRAGLVGVSVVLLTLTACSTHNKTLPSGPANASAATVALSNDCSSAQCSGDRQGAKYDINLPGKANWNGTLIIWSHGYRNAAPIPSNPLSESSPTDPVDTTAQAAPSKDVANALTAKGYALVGSAFKTEGWDVQDGVAAANDLYSFFSSTVGKPQHVYVWGESLGGLITETLAETHQPWISGAAPLCGVLGGTNLNLDLALDVAYAVKTLVYPDLKLTGFSSHADAVAQWKAASRALAAKATSSAEGIADLLTIAAISGAPAKTTDFDGHDTTSTGQAYAEAIVTALGYGTWGRYDIEQRVGGNPSQNAGTDYVQRVGDSARSLINLAAPGKLNAILAQLAAGQRVSADGAARTKADGLGDPTGAIQVPTVTLHTIDDPLVISQNETIFAGRAAKNSTSTGLLTQLFTAPPVTYQKAPYGAGHCNFTPTELTGVIDYLDGWVRNGHSNASFAATALGYDPASTPAQQAAGTAKTGYQPALEAGAWPVAAAK